MKFSMLIEDQANGDLRSVAHDLKVAGVTDVWVRDIPLVGTDGDLGFGLDPSAGLVALTQNYPTLTSVGVAAFGARYWPESLLARSISSLLALTECRVRAGIGSGEKPGLSISDDPDGDRLLAQRWRDVSSLLQHREVGGLRLAGAPRRSELWTVSSRSEVWKSLHQAPEGIVLRTQSPNGIREVSQAWHACFGSLPEIAMMIPIAELDAADLTLTSNKNRQAFSASTREMSRYLSLLGAAGVSEIILDFSPASVSPPPELIRELIDTLTSAESTKRRHQRTGAGKGSKT